MASNPDPSTVIGLTEITLLWNDDFQLDETGDLLVSADTSPYPEATAERLIRMVMTCSALEDVNGNPLGQADDIFHPTWGASARAYVDNVISADGIAKLRASILAQVLADPGVAASPPPTVSIDYVTLYTYRMILGWNSNSGGQYTLPTLQISPDGVTVLSEVPQ